MSNRMTIIPKIKLEKETTAATSGVGVGKAKTPTIVKSRLAATTENLAKVKVVVRVRLRQTSMKSYNNSKVIVVRNL